MNVSYRALVNYSVDIGHDDDEISYQHVIIDFHV